jgi:cytochrome c oxidase cbb3-type subunit 2
LLAEVKRYGPYTRAGETVYDRPFLWGSKRTGPDLQRIGGKYSDIWHRLHLINPRDVVENSIMPAYPWLVERAANADDDIQLKMLVLRKLGHPYTDAEIEAAPAALQGLAEIDALIAYLQVLGTSRKPGDTP